jgi:hypothetical protein
MNQPRRRAIVARHVSFVLAAAVVVCVQATVCLSDGAESICEHPVVKHAFLQSMMCENPSALNCAEQGKSLLWKSHHILGSAEKQLPLRVNEFRARFVSS